MANSRGSESRDAKALATSAYELVRPYGADVGNLRVSRPAIEFDLLLASRDNLASVTGALEPRLGALLSVRELDTPPPSMDVDQAIRDGIQLFNEERYWESHESLEYAWRRAEGSDKDVLQGMILVAAGLVHLQKSEEGVALGVLARASEKLSPYRGERFGVSIDDLRKTVSQMIVEKKPNFFKIQIRSHSSRAAA